MGKLLLISLLMASGLAVASDRDIQHPAGGWTHSGLLDTDAQIGYAYPNNLIDRGGQRGRTLIEGQLKSFDKRQRHPPTLVVNGNAMPLYSDEHGRFARPYAFGPGSNTLSLRSANGKTIQSLQFFDTNPLRARAQVRIILAWDEPHAELDLHVLTPDGGHAFFADPILATGGGLDVDSVDGAGPEMFSVTAPVHGTYHVYVNYWGNFGAEGYHFDESVRQQPIITARVTLVFDENTGAERRETFVIPMRKIGELQLVRSFNR